MRAGARVAAAIEVLDAWMTGGGGLDRALAAWGRRRRYAGARDRAAVADLCYAALRRRGECAAAMGARAGTEDARALVFGALAVIEGRDAAAVRALCADPHAPPPPDAEEARRLDAAAAGDWGGGACEDGALDEAARWNLPPPLAEMARAAFGAGAAAEMKAFGARAPLDLRVNALWGGRSAAQAALAAEGIAAAPGRWSPMALRAAPAADGRAPRVEGSAAWRDGAVEIQDEGSQLAGLLCAARPGMRALDLCAGGGGKALLLAAEMENRGIVYAHDAAPRRLAPLAVRAARAGASCVRLIADPAEAAGADLVLVDAPCSGSGTWRRNPDAKWRLDAAAIAAMAARQRALLDRAVDLARPGGRIVYVVCSWTPAETDAVADALLASRPDVAPDPLTPVGALAPFRDSDAPPPTRLLTTPAAHDVDGFFCAAFRRR